ncbi:MAG: Rap1a/Tai family immunity protein [Rhizomicrobium sp.]
MQSKGKNQMPRFVILTLLAASASVCVDMAACEPVSNDSFVASSLYAACTHSVSDAKTKADQEYLEQTCTTYLRGLTDALFVMQSLQARGTATCLPTDQAISVQEARSVFETYLRDHPQVASNSAGLVAAMSLVAAHHCS